MSIIAPSSLPPLLPLPQPLLQLLPLPPPLLPLLPLLPPLLPLPLPPLPLPPLLPLLPPPLPPLLRTCASANEFRLGAHSASSAARSDRVIAGSAASRISRLSGVTLTSNAPGASRRSSTSAGLCFASYDRHTSPHARASCPRPPGRPAARPVSCTGSRTQSCTHGQMHAHTTQPASTQSCTHGRMHAHTTQPASQAASQPASQPARPPASQPRLTRGRSTGRPLM
jgi:hypothetical protein